MNDEESFSFSPSSSPLSSGSAATSHQRNTIVRDEQWNRKRKLALFQADGNASGPWTEPDYDRKGGWRDQTENLQKPDIGLKRSRRLKECDEAWIDGDAFTSPSRTTRASTSSIKHRPRKYESFARSNSITVSTPFGVGTETVSSPEAAQGSTHRNDETSTALDSSSPTTRLSRSRHSSPRSIVAEDNSEMLPPPSRQGLHPTDVRTSLITPSKTPASLKRSGSSFNDSPLESTVAHSSAARTTPAFKKPPAFGITPPLTHPEHHSRASNAAPLRFSLTRAPSAIMATGVVRPRFNFSHSAPPSTQPQHDDPTSSASTARAATTLLDTNPLLLHAAFSPHRSRKHRTRFVPGGAAATLRAWVLDAAGASGDAAASSVVYDVLTSDALFPHRSAKDKEKNEDSVMQPHVSVSAGVSAGTITLLTCCARVPASTIHDARSSSTPREVTLACSSNLLLIGPGTYRDNAQKQRGCAVDGDATPTSADAERVQVQVGRPTWLLSLPAGVGARDDDDGNDLKTREWVICPSWSWSRA